MHANGRLTRSKRHVTHRNARQTWAEREAAVLELEWNGVRGAGEAAPLPGYSHDDLATCLGELELCWAKLGEIDVEAPIRETFRNAAKQSGVRAPAATFALETALLDLVAKTRRQPAWVVLRGEDRRAAIPLSALAEGSSPQELADAAERACDRGLRVIKIKVGGVDAIVRDPPRLEAVRARIGPHVALRLDANQTLPGENLAETLRAFAAFAPELIEEPAVPLIALSQVESPVPFALDESLMLPDWAEHVRLAGARGTYVAVVLKPMSLGGFERCFAIADAAQAAGLGVIVTHTFDGPIAAAAAACLALALPFEVRACGLDTEGRFAPVAAISQTHVVPFDANGLGVAPLT